MARRNNQDRIAGPKDADTPPTKTSKQEDDFLSFVNPTDFVDLPSKGLYYPEDHPLHGVESVEIRHMTAKEEDILTNACSSKVYSSASELISDIIKSP